MRNLRRRSKKKKNWRDEKKRNFKKEKRRERKKSISRTKRAGEVKERKGARGLN